MIALQRAPGCKNVTDQGKHSGMATTAEPPATTRLRNDCTPRATPRKANVTPTKATATTSMASTAAGANEATTATITPRLRHSSTVARPTIGTGSSEYGGSAVARAIRASIQGIPP